jgi:hypothetical protein
MKYNIGDRIITRKKHVCGSDTWIVERMGAEVRIKCAKCGREVMMLKMELDRKIKEVHSETP